jgi:hypothetical protein
MYIQNHYSLLHEVALNAQQLPDLQALIIQQHGTRIRRIDRYIQLCIAGGLGCAKTPLAANTGLYLATRCGAVATSANVMETIAAQNELPKPLHFVNTLGNSAGFYLTQLLGLTGTALVVSKERQAFEAALTHGLLDLQNNVSQSVLIGGFDEVTRPLTQQLQRLDAPANAPALFEGSHWLLLSQQAQGSRQSVGMPRYHGHLREALQQHTQTPSEPIQLDFLPDQAEREQLQDRAFSVFRGEDLAQGTIPHGVFSAASLMELIQQQQTGLHISRAANGYYCCVKVNGPSRR